MLPSGWGARGEGASKTGSYPPGKLSAVNTCPLEFQVPQERGWGDMGIMQGKRPIQVPLGLFDCRSTGQREHMAYPEPTRKAGRLAQVSSLHM